jgi:hypothetical protein
MFHLVFLFNEKKNACKFGDGENKKGKKKKGGWERLLIIC